MANSTFKKTLSLMAYENKLTKDIADDYTLRVKTQSASLDVAAIAREVAVQQGKYQQDEITLILNKSYEIIADAVASGYIVNLPLCLIQPKVSGVVMKNELSLAPDRRKIKVGVGFTMGGQLRSALASAHLELYVQPAPVGPLLNGAVSTRLVTDEQGTETRAPLAAGDMCMLTGNNIKLVGTDPSVGILLTSVETPAKTYFIEPNRVSPNEPKRLQFVLPTDIADGAWTVNITTQFGSGHSLVAAPRSYVLEGALIVGNVGEGDVEDPIV